DGDDLQRVMECTHTQYISIVNKLLNTIVANPDSISQMVNNGLLSQLEGKVLMDGQQHNRLLKTTSTMATLADASSDLADMVEKFSLVINNTKNSLTEVVYTFGGANDNYVMAMGEKKLAQTYSILTGKSEVEITNELIQRGYRPLGAELSMTAMQYMNGGVVADTSVTVTQVSTPTFNGTGRDIIGELTKIGYPLNPIMTTTAGIDYVDHLLNTFAKPFSGGIAESVHTWYNFSLYMGMHVGIDLDENPIVFPLLNTILMDQCLTYTSNVGMPTDITSIINMIAPPMLNIFDIHNSYLQMRDPIVHNMAVVVGNVFNSLGLTTGFKSKLDGTFDSKLLAETIPFTELTNAGAGVVSHVKGNSLTTGISNSALINVYIANNPKFMERVPSIADVSKRPMFTTQKPIISAYLRNTLPYMTSIPNLGVYINGIKVAEAVYTNLAGQVNMNNTPESVDMYKSFIQDSEVLDYCSEYAALYNLQHEIENNVSWSKIAENRCCGLVSLSRGRMIQNLMKNPTLATAEIVGALK
ncbi:MAG: hypothetical protein ACRCX2_32255, partial [Paraclostridium sp.]